MVVQLYRHLFRLSQVRHVGVELASYPLLLVIGQVVAIEGEEGFGGLAILVGAPLLDGVFWFWKLGYDPFFKLTTLAFAFGKPIFNYRLLAPLCFADDFACVVIDDEPYFCFR